MLEFSQYPVIRAIFQRRKEQQEAFNDKPRNASKKLPFSQIGDAVVTAIIKVSQRRDYSAGFGGKVFFSFSRALALFFCPCINDIRDFCGIIQISGFFFHRVINERHFVNV